MCLPPLRQAGRLCHPRYRQLPAPRQTRERSMPRFTVLLPVHRPPALLPFAIETVLAQEVDDFELFVICDGAPAETAACARDYARRDKRVRVFTFAKGERHGEAYRHQALTQAGGE